MSSFSAISSLIADSAFHSAPATHHPDQQYRARQYPWRRAHSENQP